MLLDLLLNLLLNFPLNLPLNLPANLQLNLPLNLLLNRPLKLPLNLLLNLSLNLLLDLPYKGYRRVGTPRLNWVEDNMARAYQKIGEIRNGPERKFILAIPSLNLSIHIIKCAQDISNKPLWIENSKQWAGLHILYFILYVKNPFSS